MTNIFNKKLLDSDRYNKCNKENFTAFREIARRFISHKAKPKIFLYRNLDTRRVEIVMLNTNITSLMLLAGSRYQRKALSDASDNAYADSKKNKLIVLALNNIWSSKKSLKSKIMLLQSLIRKRKGRELLFAFFPTIDKVILLKALQSEHLSRYLLPFYETYYD